MSQRSTAYKDAAARDVAETLEVVRDIEAEFDAFKAKFDFSAISALTGQDSLKKVKNAVNELMAVLKEVNE